MKWNRFQHIIFDSLVSRGYHPVEAEKIMLLSLSEKEGHEGKTNDLLQEYEDLWSVWHDKYMKFRATIDYFEKDIKEFSQDLVDFNTEITKKKPKGV